MHLRRLFILGTIIALVATACWKPSLTPDYTYTVQTVVYGQGEVDGGGSFTDLELDLYVPEVPGQTIFPLVVLIHGGGFQGGSKANDAFQARQFASRGYVAAAINYRLTGDDPVPSDRVGPIWDQVGGASAPPQTRAFVAAVDDTLSALDFLHARPEVEPWSTVLHGTSAGATTSLYVGYGLDDFGIERPLVSAVISNSGRFHSSEGPATFIEEDRGTIIDGPYLYAEPPVYLTHATGDPVMPFSHAQDIVDLAEAIGHPYRIFAHDAATHGFNLFQTNVEPGVSVFQDQINWLDEVLLGARSTS